MKKFAYIVPGLLCALVLAVPAHAQIGGCTDSPENPTAVLGLVVSAASIGFVKLRAHFGSRKK